MYPINEQQVAEIDQLYDEIWNFDEPEESESFKIFSDLYYDRRIEPDELRFKVIKLEKLGVSKAKIDAVKKSNNLGLSSSWGCDYAFISEHEFSP